MERRLELRDLTTTLLRREENRRFLDPDALTKVALGLGTSDRPASQTSVATNHLVSPDWAHRVTIIGAGSYGTSVGQRIALKLAGQQRDVMLWDRNQGKVDEINSSHTNRRALGDQSLSQNLLATSDLQEALNNRGIIIIALASNALPHVLPRIIPHPDSVVISLTKGFVIPEWNPLIDPQAVVRGPAEGCNVYTPLQYMKTLSAWADIQHAVAVAGPGFARNIARGPDLSRFGLTAASHSEFGRKKCGYLLQDAGIKMRLSSDPLGVEIAAALKNVVAIATGVVGGLKGLDGQKLCGPEEHELVKQMGMEEILRFSKWLAEKVQREGGVFNKVKHRTQHTFAGWPDLNLTTGNIESRNTRVGHALAEGKGIFEILDDLSKKDQTAEGVAAAWGAKRLTDPRRLSDSSFEAGLQMPLTNALIDLMQKLITPEQFVQTLLTEPLTYHDPDEALDPKAGGAENVDYFKPKPFSAFDNSPSRIPTQLN